MPVALNVSPRVLLDPGFPRSVEAQLRRAGLDGEALLEIEITEDSLMGDHAAARAALANLRAIGVRTSIDDFGTGYSSLAYLRELTVYALKIDQAFVTRRGDRLGFRGDPAVDHRAGARAGAARRWPKGWRTWPIATGWRRWGATACRVLRWRGRCRRMGRWSGCWRGRTG